MACPIQQSAPLLNPAVLALDWLLGSWESDEPGEGSFPTVPPFRYSETLHFTHVGQPVINFMFNAFHTESKKPNAQRVWVYQASARYKQGGFHHRSELRTGGN
uniref:THAP4-like heme-binding domain-containing protein n=1 Tax=Anguilla anguilla TaxID=7936 RepID=A0A0E9WLA9_ANGAN